MKRKALIATLASAIAFGASVTAVDAQADAARSAPTPYPTRAEDWPGTGVIRVFGWMKDNRDFFWSERDKKQHSIVFAGDSLTGTWKTLGADFPGALVANRGIGGDVSRGLLFRFEEDVLALHPKAIVILIGINDLTAKQLANTTLANVRSLLDLSHSQAPKTPVILCTVPPSASPKAPVDEQQRRLLNEGLRKMASETRKVSVVDLFAALSTAEGKPDARYFAADQLHLSAAGHQRWREVLLPALRDAGAL